MIASITTDGPQCQLAQSTVSASGVLHCQPPSSSSYVLLLYAFSYVSIDTVFRHSISIEIKCKGKVRVKHRGAGIAGESAIGNLRCRMRKGDRFHRSNC